MTPSFLPQMFLLSLGLAGVLTAAPALAQEPPGFVVTTDTPQYCGQLAREVVTRQARMAAPPRQEVQHLLDEGRSMCDRGQIRGGIARLRRALVMLHRRSLPAP